MLVYPGLGNGQFGPPVNGTKGFPVGTNPTGLTVADLNGQPDLLVADTGSNDVSVLLGQGSGSSWTMIPGARIHTDAGPVAMVVGNLLGRTQTDLAVANSGANDVQIFPGVGGGFFKTRRGDQDVCGRPGAVLAVPGQFQRARPGIGHPQLGLEQRHVDQPGSAGQPGAPDLPDRRRLADGRVRRGLHRQWLHRPGGGQQRRRSLALLIGGPGGLSLFQTLSSAEVPNPTALSFGGVSDGLLSFYVSTAGHEAATNLTFNLNGDPSGGGGTSDVINPTAESSGGVTSGVVTATEGSSAGVLSQATSGSVQSVSQLLSLSGTTLDLAATLLTVSVVEFESGGSTSATGGSTGAGQGPGSSEANDSSSDSEDEPSDEAEPDDGASQAIVERAAAWERLVIGLERSWERARP